MEDEDSVISLKDVIEEDQELQDTANAVLGGSDDTNCTYPEGYITRQAVYSCATCVPNTSPSAGICLACSLHCHEGHELYELYTKRHFRCDCGNSRFAGNPCHLYPNKDPQNEENIYNHNFKGVYCTCKRPYPDNEDEIEDEMLQCIVCEDWYHSRHLGCPPPQSYEEMVCDLCMIRLHFLRCYQLHSPSIETTEAEDVSILSTEAISGMDSPKSETEDVVSKDSKLSTTVKVESDSGESTQQTQTETGSVKTETNSVPTETHTDDTTISKNQKDLETITDPTNCLLMKRKKLLDQQFSGPAYFLSNWRTELCQCSSCTKMYEEHNITYLCNTLDSVKAYEERAQSTKYIHEAGLEALGSTMGHVQQVEMIQGYNHMKQELTKFLAGFANSGKVVRSRDIDDFFGELQNNKRRRLDSGEGVPPDNCR